MQLKLYDNLYYANEYSGNLIGETSGDYEDILLKLLAIPEEFQHEVEELNENEELKDKEGSEPEQKSEDPVVVEENKENESA